MKFFKFLKNKYYEKKCNVPKDLPNKCVDVLKKTNNYQISFRLNEMTFVINDIKYKFYYNRDYNGVGIYINNVFFAKANETTTIEISEDFKHKLPNINIIDTLKTFVDFINEKSK